MFCSALGAFFEVKEVNLVPRGVGGPACYWRIEHQSMPAWCLFVPYAVRSSTNHRADPVVESTWSHWIRWKGYRSVLGGPTAYYLNVVKLPPCIGAHCLSFTGSLSAAARL